MYRIKTFDRIAERGLHKFSADVFEVGEDVEEAHAILLRSHKLNQENADGGLLAVARAGAGVNNVPVEACSRRGIVVFNTPGANANSVKELVVAAMLLGSRDVVGGINFVEGIPQGQPDLHTLVESNKKLFRGHEIQGKTLGIVGLGNIGSRVARAALDLGMEVVGYDPALSVSRCMASAKPSLADAKPAQAVSAFRLCHPARAVDGEHHWSGEPRQPHTVPRRRDTAELRARGSRQRG